MHLPLAIRALHHVPVRRGGSLMMDYLPAPVPPMRIRFASRATRRAWIRQMIRVSRERCATMAEDLMQDAFVKGARRLVHLRDPDTFGAYLRRTVVSLTNSYFRRRRLERVVRPGEILECSFYGGFQCAPAPTSKTSREKAEATLISHVLSRDI